MNRIVQTRGTNDGLLIFDINTRLAYVPMIKIERKDISRIEEISELCLAGKRIAREILDAGLGVRVLWMRYYGLSVSTSAKERKDVADLCRRAIRAYAFSGNEIRRFTSRGEMLDAYGRDTAPIGKRLDSGSDIGDVMRGYEFPPPVFRDSETDIAVYLTSAPSQRSHLTDDALRFLDRIEEIEGIERVEFRANGLVSVSVGKAFLWSDIEPRIVEALMLLAGSRSAPIALPAPTASPEEPQHLPVRRSRRPHWKPRAEVYMKIRMSRSIALRAREDVSDDKGARSSDVSPHVAEDEEKPEDNGTPQPFWPFDS